MRGGDYWGGLLLPLFVTAQFVCILTFLLFHVVFDALLNVLLEFTAFEDGERIQLKLVNFITFS